MPIEFANRVVASGAVLGSTEPQATMIQGRAAAKPSERLESATAQLELVRGGVASHLDATTTRQGNVAHAGGRIQHPTTVQATSAAAETSPISRLAEARVQLDELLEFVRQHGCSDLHLSPGNPPMVRHNGEVRRLALPALDAKDVHALVYDVMNDAQRKAYERDLELDFSFALPGLGRFRVNVLSEVGGVGAVMRAVPMHVPSLDELKAPALLKTIAEYKRGLVLVTGPTGSGKSTTLAAMVRHRNEHSTGHIVTIEDPIEFTHESKGCLIRQRELGTHTKSFAAALQSALRDDPNVIMVGELRDLETIRLALTAAETGHLVLATLHTSSAPKTIDRIIDVFPTEDKAQARVALSESLAAVVSQQLLPTKDGSGRVAAHELMVCNPAIRNLIRESKTAQIAGLLPTQRDIGNQSMDQALQELVKNGTIGSQVAKSLGV